eukprot:4829541-Pleurochrysis_carterae.AAC.1
MVAASNYRAGPLPDLGQNQRRACCCLGCCHGHALAWQDAPNVVGANVSLKSRRARERVVREPNLRRV